MTSLPASASININNEDLSFWYRIFNVNGSLGTGVKGEKGIIGGEQHFVQYLEMLLYLGLWVLYEFNRGMNSIGY